MIDKKEPKEVEQVSGDAPPTKEMLVAQFHQLADSIRAAGLNPLQMLLQTYKKRGMAVIAGLMAGLGDEDISKKAKE